MAFNKIKIVLLAGTSLFILSCHETTTTTQTQPETPTASRLTFTGTAHTGGTVKVTLDDNKLELVLDGDPNYVSTVMPIPAPPYLAPRASMINIEMTDLNYYGDIVTVTCVESDANKIYLEWRGAAGNFYENTGGTMYVFDSGGPEYLEQKDDEALLEAVIPTPNPPSLPLGAGYYYFTTDCTGSDGSDYRVSFYDSSTSYTHGITTTFSVTDGTVEGIIRVHRIGDGYHPYMDILL
jgi:hypothetical protein